jgi:hypothetical protein
MHWAPGRPVPSRRQVTSPSHELAAGAYVRAGQNQGSGSAVLCSLLTVCFFIITASTSTSGYYVIDFKSLWIQLDDVSRYWAQAFLVSGHIPWQALCFLVFLIYLWSVCKRNFSSLYINWAVWFYLEQKLVWTNHPRRLEQTSQWCTTESYTTCAHVHTLIQRRLESFILWFAWENST